MAIDLDGLDGVVAVEIEGLMKDVGFYERRSRANNTQRSYGTAWENYKNWCESRGFGVVPGRFEVVNLWLVSLAKTHKASTISSYLSGVRHYYRRLVGDENPAMHSCVDRVRDGLLRELELRPEQSEALTLERLRVCLGKVDGGTVRGKRERALLLVGYACAFRRSELCGLNWEDLKRERWGYRIELRRSKGDQYGRGRFIGLHRGANKETCPVRALNAWRKLRVKGQKAVFTRVDRHGNNLGRRLHPDSMNRVVKEVVGRAELGNFRYTSHSLRSGLITDLSNKGKAAQVVQGRSRHRSTGMVERYYRPGEVAQVNWSEMVGL